MIEGRVAAIGGAALAVLLAVGFLLWQVNTAIKRAAQDAARIVELEKALEDEREEYRGAMTSMGFLLEGCKFDLMNYVNLSDSYRAEVEGLESEIEALESQPPPEPIINLVAENCVDGLVEGHRKVIAIMEGRHDTPYP